MGLQITENMFNQFLKVQRGGQYNMFDPRAREMTHLSKEQWGEIMKQYADLENKYKEDKE